MAVKNEHKQVPILVYVSSDLLDVIQRHLASMDQVLVHVKDMNGTPVYRRQSWISAAELVQDDAGGLKWSEPQPTSPGAPHRVTGLHGPLLDEVLAMTPRTDLKPGEHDWRRLTGVAQKRCLKCNLWEVPETLEKPCGQPTYGRYVKGKPDGTGK